MLTKYIYVKHNHVSFLLKKSDTRFYDHLDLSHFVSQSRVSHDKNLTVKSF